MARLTAATVRGLRAPGKYGDGNGLWLQVGSASQRSWLARFTLAGKPREMGLGSADEVSLAEAREKNEAVRKLVRDGVDPISRRRAGRKLAIEVDQRRVSFALAAQRYIEANEAGWHNAKHGLQWRNTLSAYALPMIGEMACGEIGTDDVLEVLEPIWLEKPATAVRLRGRIEIILSYATVRGWRDGLNPAIWRGHLQLMLPAKGKIAPVKHHPALDWRQAPAFVAALRQLPGMAAAALQFAILTGARSKEVREAPWVEINTAEAVWSLPAGRMKAKRPHRVPLAQPALDLLAELAPLRGDAASLIFPGYGRSNGRYRALSGSSLSAVLRRMGHGDLTTHGFRATFRNWVADSGRYSVDVAERALAHVIGDQTRGAYETTDLFDLRRKLMADWAAYLFQPSPQVLTFRRSHSASIELASGAESAA